MQRKIDVQAVCFNLWSRRPVERDYAILGLILLGATWLRFNGLNDAGLWLDEVYYSIIAQQPIVDQIFRPVETVSALLGNDPILAAIPFSISLMFGFANYLVRFPAALFGVLSVAVIYKLGRDLFGNYVGLLAAAMLAASTFHVFYSQEARSYSQLLFFSTAAFWFFYRAAVTTLDGQGRSGVGTPFQKYRRVCRVVPVRWLHWIAYAGFMWGGVSSSYAMMFTIPIHALTLAIYSLQSILKSENDNLMLSQLGRTWSSFLVALSTVLLLRLPWLGAFTYSLEHNTVGALPLPDFAAAFFALREVLMGNQPFFSLLFIGLCGIGLVAALARRPKPGALLACWLIFSIPISIIGLWLAGHFFHPRFVIWVLPAFFLAAACGMVIIADLAGKRLIPTTVRQRADRAAFFPQSALLALLVIPILIVNLHHGRHHTAIKQSSPRGQLQVVSSRIVAEAGPGEAVIAIGLPARHIQFFTARNRQDLIYLDDQSFVQHQSAQTLPANLSGRWYVIHNAYQSPNIPKNWVDNIQYELFHDIVVVYKSRSCQIRGCIEDTKLLLTEISAANPGSALEKTVRNIMVGFSQLNF